MRILDGCEFDKIVHRLVSNCEWRITFRVVLTISSMVKVVAEQGSTFFCPNLIAVNQSFYLFCCSMNKEKRGEKRLRDDSLLSLLSYLFISQRNITIQSFSLYECFCLDDTPIRNSQNEPLLVSRRHILYRHPIFVLLDGGRTRGKSCTWTR